MMGETLMIGLFIALIFYELTDISPGGMIVPGMIAYYFYDPRRIVLTILIAIVASTLVKALANHLIIFGKRKFVMHIIVAALIAVLLSLSVQWFSLTWFDIPIIGTVIAGILAHEVTRQGIIKTISALCIVVLITIMLVLLI
jgi:gamma-polyglutamate biosynthesis protein CapC